MKKIIFTVFVIAGLVAVTALDHWRWHWDFDRAGFITSLEDASDLEKAMYQQIEDDFPWIKKAGDIELVIDAHGSRVFFAVQGTLQQEVINEAAGSCGKVTRACWDSRTQLSNGDRFWLKANLPDGQLDLYKPIYLEGKTLGWESGGMGYIFNDTGSFSIEQSNTVKKYTPWFLRIVDIGL